MNVRIKRKLLRIANNIAGIFYPRRRIRDCGWDSVKNIIIIRPDRIGDVILSLPALRELKKKRPDVILTMVVSSYTRELLDESKIIDSLIVLEPGMGLRGWIKFIRTLRRVKYDLAVDMLFSRQLLSGFIVFLTKAKIKLGFDSGVKSLFFNCHLSPQDGEKYEAQRNFELLKYLIAPDDVDMSLGSDCIVPDPGYIDSLSGNGRIDKNRLYAGIHPGAYKNVTNRLWPPERYAELADKIIDNYGAVVFFTGSGSSEDKELLETIERKMKNKAVFINGQASLRQLYALYERLNVFIGTFTGPLHLAAAAGLSTVVLGGPTPVKRWMPQGEKHVLIQAGLDCVPCGDRPDCLRKDYACMRDIPAERVFKAVEGIISDKVK